ncbi:TetR family transcriptional regulator [Enterovibrio norvegicus FF-33]|uniref:TetR/AcrR family transcriptional regulator n=1 Tax=Enterovibrio norvegicus TaxID=188144 RepID=UPI0002D52A64|nr:TetR/AcrR family transcriptional regulator [Enterovibrio norvegicus]OEE67009.1 TetR family transcriptional regulator [Enterovibrio norvegicus FF-33]OEE82068.1 TetR family transcriptional regulator [Enterovibrio norvegicus FF-162]
MSRIRAKNQEKIIDVASQLFAEKGYAATTTAEIAQRAEIPKPNLYYYFNTKDNLYRAVLESVTLPLLEASLPIEQLDDPREALTQYIRTKLRISRDHASASKTFAAEVMAGAPHLPRDIAEALIDQSKMILNKFDYWIAQGWMDPVPAKHLMFMLWSSTQTYADFNWQICQVCGQYELDDEDFEQAAEFLVNLVLKGCGVKHAD